MDGAAADADLLFVLTTNRADLLEPALAARPGRVDVAIEIDLPDADGPPAAARAVRAVRCRFACRTPRPRDVVERTDGVTASFLKELLRRAMLEVARRRYDRPSRHRDARVACARRPARQHSGADTQPARRGLRPRQPARGPLPRAASTDGRARLDDRPGARSGTPHGPIAQTTARRVQMATTDAFDAVPETMLWNLHHRAAEARRPDAVLADPVGVELADRLGPRLEQRFGAAHPLLAQAQALRALALRPRGSAVLGLQPGRDGGRSRRGARDAVLAGGQRPRAVAVGRPRGGDRGACGAPAEPGPPAVGGRLSAR